MRKSVFALVAALATAPLAACAMLSPDPAGPSQPQTLADAQKALTIAHLAYQGVGLALQNAAQSGALHGADAVAARALFDKAGAFLDAADKAEALADAQGIADAVAQATALIAQIDALIQK